MKAVLLLEIRSFNKIPLSIFAVKNGLSLLSKETVKTSPFSSYLKKRVEE